MISSTYQRAMLLLVMVPVAVGCARDTMVAPSSLDAAVVKSRSLTPPAEFVNAPNATPMEKQVASDDISQRIVDSGIQQASHTQPASAKGNRKTKVAVARLTERSGKIERAKSMYQAILSDEPGNQLAYHRLGVIAAQQKQWSQAERYFRKAYTIGRPSAQLLSDMSYYYYLRHQLDEARQLASRALKLDPKNTTAHNNLGLILGEQGYYAESLSSFKRAVPQAEAHANLAFVLAQAGAPDDALQHYSLALSQDKHLRSAGKAMMQLAERKSQQQVPISPSSDAVAGTTGGQPASAVDTMPIAPAEPDYAAATIADAPQLEASSDPPLSEVPDELIHTGHMELPSTERSAAAAPEPVAVPRPTPHDLAEQLAQYLEETSSPGTNQREAQRSVVAAVESPNDAVQQQVALTTSDVLPAEIQALKRELRALTRELKAGPDLAKLAHQEGGVHSPSASDAKDEPVKVADNRANSSPAVQPRVEQTIEKPDPELLAKQEASKKHQATNDLLDVDGALTKRGSYRPRSRVATAQPRKQSTTVKLVQPVPAKAKTPPRARSQVSRQTKRAALTNHATTPTKKVTPKRPTTPPGALDLDRLPERSRWDSRASRPSDSPARTAGSTSLSTSIKARGAWAMSREVSRHVVPRPVRSKQPSLSPRSLAEQPMASKPKIANRNTSTEATQIRFVDQAGAVKVAHSGAGSKPVDRVVRQASHEESVSTQPPKKRVEPNSSEGFSVRFKAAD